MRFRNKIRKTIGTLLAASLVALNYSTPVRLFRNLPENISLYQGQSLDLSLGLPSLVTLEKGDNALLRLSQAAATGSTIFHSTNVEIYPEECGETSLFLSLFGIIRVKSVNVQVYPELMVIPGGQSIGVSLYTRGLLVVGVSDLAVAGGSVRRPAEEAGLEAGDIILEANGQTLTDARSLSNILQDQGELGVTLTVSRNGQKFAITARAVRDEQDGVYRLGVWVRDSSAGVGTLTFYNPTDGTFGALGHAIKDLDTDVVLDVREGTIQYSDIVDIQHSVRGTPGELRGIFYGNDKIIGNITQNTPFGLFGDALTSIENPIYSQPIPVASHSEVRVGEATLLTTIDEEGMKEYACRIIRVYNQEERAIKSMVVEITDPELISKTGGIVQGMSGSPLIQNGKLIGAITHVFINDPTKGHAVFAEWMVMQSNIAE